MKCLQTEPLLVRFVGGPGDLSMREFASVGEHVRQCAACTAHAEELRWVIAQLEAQPHPKAPADLASKLHLRLASEPDPARSSLGDRLRAIVNWPSMIGGAAIAAALMFFVLHGAQPTVGIQVASVPVDQNVGVQIAFDVGHDVKNVTFDLKLSDGLRFVDAKGQPVNTQEVKWKGELLRGKTVVPVTVRGIRPGRWEILAVVRKDQMARATQIIVPVLGNQTSLVPNGEG